MIRSIQPMKKSYARYVKEGEGVDESGPEEGVCFISEYHRKWMYKVE